MTPSTEEQLYHWRDWFTVNWHNKFVSAKCSPNVNPRKNIKMSPSFQCLLLTMSTPVDDFLWSYSQRFVSQMRIEVPPCLPSSPPKHSLMFQSAENWRLHYSTEKLCAHLWKKRPIPVDHRFISCLLFFLTPPENGGCWWSDDQTCWALLTVLSKANSIPVADLCLWYIPSNLLVQPKWSLLALFKHGGLVRSFQVFSLWDIQQRQLREQIN